MPQKDLAPKDFSDENKEALPLLFAFAEEQEATATREVADESEYWTQPYEIPDSD